MKKVRDMVRISFPYLWIFGSFCLLDAWLRVMTRWIGFYSIYAPAPNLFTVLWAAVLTVLVTLPRSRTGGRVLYGVVYYLFAAYSIVQYGSYLILGKFLFVSEFLLAGEGADYASFVTTFITPGFLGQVAALLAVGAIGIRLFPKRRDPAQKRSAREWLLRGTAMLLSAAGIAVTPALYGDYTNERFVFVHPAYAYEKFIGSNQCLEVAGLYQYAFRDIQMQCKRLVSARQADITPIEEFFAQRPAHAPNEMTGVFEGKNLIVLMLESMDDIAITEQDTPTLYRLMQEGINFTNLYTPAYSSGYTFNTEFAFNTSTYPYANNNVIYALTGSDFSSGLAGQFNKAGYRVNSYHEGYPEFYNRGVMHRAFGYQKYHSYQAYVCDLPIQDDRYLTRCDALYREVVSGAPFYSFVITYSAHLPYEDSDTHAQYALSQYPQYDVQENRALNIYRAQARMTDDMVAELLARLEADGLLEDTVIVGFADHYAYGLPDKAQLQQLSEANGSSILERTPAFVYCADWSTPLQVDKTMQITDLGPTIMNLFGMEVPADLMGRDIFDANYTGYAIFPGGTWITDRAYAKEGIVRWNEGMTDAEIQEMNRFVGQCYDINDRILDTDYYARKKQK